MFQGGCFMTFDLFLHKYADADTPEGDFARDWGQDKNTPTVKTWDDIYYHLVGRAHPEVVEIAKELFKQWK
jgi:hypothetical protein